MNKLIKTEKQIVALKLVQDSYDAQPWYKKLSSDQRSYNPKNWNGALRRPVPNV